MVRHSGLPSELVLRAAARTDTGNYSCVAENSHGLGESGTLAVSVEFAPACVRAAPQRVAISVHESIDLECAVTSRPGNVRWSRTYRILAANAHYIVTIGNTFSFKWQMALGEGAEVYEVGAVLKLRITYCD